MKYSKTPHFKLPFVVDRMPLSLSTDDERDFYDRSYNQKIYKRQHHKRQRQYNANLEKEEQIDEI